MNRLTHTDNKGKALMIDVSDKVNQTRIAKAKGHISMAADTLRLIEENMLKKGDVLNVARIAGISAAKRTPDLVPLCHNIIIDYIHVDAVPEKNGVTVASEVRCFGRTGAEMEALTAVSVALLTMYDMCKSVDKDMIIDYIRLIEKTKI